MLKDDAIGCESCATKFFFLFFSSDIHCNPQNVQTSASKPVRFHLLNSRGAPKPNVKIEIVRKEQLLSQIESIVFAGEG